MSTIIMWKFSPPTLIGERECLLLSPLSKCRILLKISPPPPFFSNRYYLDWIGGLFSNMHFPLNISPPGQWSTSCCGRTTPSLVTHCGKYPEFAGFFYKSGSEMTCQVDGNRRRSAVGKGLIPCVSSEESKSILTSS